MNLLPQQNRKLIKSDINVARIKRSCYALLIGITSIICLPLVEIIPIKTLKASPLNKLTSQSFVADAVGRSGPAVVTLETQRTVISQRNRGLPDRLLMDPDLQFFFGAPRMGFPRSRVERGQGSGVIFTEDGLVLTNAHVVEKTDQVMIGMSDGRRVRGQVIGQDSLTDIAVIRLNGSGPWPTAPLGDSDKVLVGDWAIAVGNPYGLENTVTLGIISNLNRNLAQLGISGKRVDLIQTDAAINPGNSGGPLLNAKGEVIGINTLVRSGPGAGLGFAIPINRARGIAKQLVEKGQVSHPVIGISLAAVSATSLEQKIQANKGALVRYVIPNSPADIGKMQTDDIILSVGKEKINSPGNVVTAINSHGVNNPLRFKIKRKGKIIFLLITPIEMNMLNRN